MIQEQTITRRVHCNSAVTVPQPAMWFAELGFELPLPSTGLIVIYWY